MATKFDIFQFLEEYQKHPCLWKKQMADYSNKDKRDRALELLLPVSGLSSIKDLKLKIRSIRSSAKGVYVPKLAWFTVANSFLRQNAEENESESNLTLPENSANSIDEAIEETIEIQNTPMMLPSKSKKRNRPQINKIDDSLDNAVKILKEVATRPAAAMNEFSIFGQHVASQLQALPLIEALIIQEEIQKLITSARLRYVQRSNVTISSSANDVTYHSTASLYTSDTTSDSAFSPTGSITNCFQNWTQP
ncbi:hypothetical protein ABEB36_003843 [Hypothenemus hampei]|uniref:MADF domain-containing protein n=1 Tax=Hypothenemus hampei TaxID=57062 RepID=A0ABD1F4G1_HYPHA